LNSWKTTYKNAAINQMEESLATVNTFPLTFLMLKNDRIIGFYQLIEQEYLVRKDLSPWIAPLFIDKSERGQALGAVLLEHARKMAGQLGSMRYVMFFKEIFTLDLELTPSMIIAVTRRCRGMMTIAEVSEKFNLTQDTLRYYERVGLIPRVNRNKSGIRNYTEEDCRWVEFIKCMRNAGLPVEVLIEYVGLFQQGDETIVVRKELLIEQRKQLIIRMEDMKKTLERLNYKIERYEQTVVVKEKTLKRP
jgi:DNA-binding transcriptional MerR regulator